MTKTISVLLTGATGTAGSGVLQACLEHPAVNKVVVLTRRTTGITHDKLIELILDDFLNYGTIESELAGFDACFWCLGVSQAKVRNEEEYHRITYEFTMEAAKVLERLNPGMTFCFLSGMGTDATQKSRMMWARVKGKAEKDLGNYDFQLYNFRPGFIHQMAGRKSSSVIWSILYPFIKNSKKMCVEADEFGMAMINAALFGSDKHILENKDIRELAKKREQ